MRGNKIFLGDGIKLGERLIYPIFSVEIIQIDNMFLNIDHHISAFKIKEEDQNYFVNIDLSEDQLNQFKEDNE